MREQLTSISKGIVRRSFMIAGTTWMVVILLIIPALLLALIFQPLQSQIEESLGYTTIQGDELSANRILSLPLKGEIDGEAPGPNAMEAGMVYGYDVARQIEEAAEKSDIKAILLVIDSPGGTIYGARAITEAVEQYRKQTGRPVVAHVAGSADSGGYWIAASTDAIVADYGTSIGGIGVIAGPYRQYTNVTSVNDEIDGQVVAGNIESLNFTSGAGKAAGDPFHKLSAEERAVIQRGVDNDYTSFVEFVAAKRQISAEVVRNRIGAHSYDPTTARELKLIDRIGGRQAALDETAKRAQLPDDDYQVVTPTVAGGGQEAGSSTVASSCLLQGRLAIVPSVKCYNN